MGDDRARADISSLIDQIIAARITVLPTVPAVLQLVASHPRFAECATLRQVWSGGRRCRRGSPISLPTSPACG